jgi:predicted transcriptional regulator
MTTLSVQLEEMLKKQIESKAAELNIHPEDLVIKAIKDYLYLERVKQLRNSLQGKAEQSGFGSEDDIMNRIS